MLLVQISSNTNKKKPARTAPTHTPKIEKAVCYWR